MNNLQLSNKSSHDGVLIKSFCILMIFLFIQLTVFAQQNNHQHLQQKPLSKTNKSKFNKANALLHKTPDEKELTSVNLEAQKVAKRKYQIIMPFFSDLAAVQFNDKWGFINRKGEEIVAVDCEKVNSFLGPTTAIKKNGIWFLINKKGETIKRFEVDHVNNFKDGKSTIILKNKYAYINHAGVILPPGWITVPGSNKSLVQQSTSNLNVSCPQNIDFEQGNFNLWKCYTGVVVPPLFDGVSGNVLYGAHGNSSTNFNETILNLSGPTPNRHEIISRAGVGNIDPYGFFSINPPDGSNYCLKLGSDEVVTYYNQNFGGYANGPGANAEAVEFSLTTPPTGDFSLTYQYAVVFEDPLDHDYDEKPRFKVEIIDASTNQPVNCGKIEYVAQPSIPGFVLSSVSGGQNSNVWYKPWTKVFVNLTSYPNKTLKLKFTTTDCTLGGHWGYAYLDIEGCQLGATAKNNCAVPPKSILSGPPGFQTYNWWNANYTSIVTTGQNVTLNNALPGGTVLHLEVIPQANPTTGEVCKDTLNVSVEQPVLNLTPIGDKNICESASVTLASSSLPNVTYAWSPSTGLSSTTTYSVNASPTDTIEYHLVATDNTTQCVARDTVVVNVKPKPILNFNTSPFCSGSSGSIKVTGADTYQWTSSPTLTIIGPDTVNVNPSGNATYSVTGTVTSTGCSATSSVQVGAAPSPVADFTPPPPQCLSANGFSFNSTSTISSGAINSTVWDFGTLGTLSGSAVTQTFSAPGTYSVTLTVTSDNNCKKSITKSVVVNPGPKAIFNPPAAQCLGNNNFSFSSLSTVPSGSITNSNWQFGDLTSQTGNSVSHSFVIADTFDIKLTVTSDKGCVDDTTIAVVVHPNANVDFIPPVPQCYVASGNQFSVISNSSIASPDYVAQDQWEFTAGSLINGTSASHTFNGYGPHSVLLISTTNNGCIDSIRKNILINPLPQVDFITPPPQCFLENNYTFSSGSSMPTGNIVSYDWNFGDGSGLSGPIVTHHYIIPNQFNYQVTLIAKSDSGCIDSSSKLITILPSPSVSVSPNGPFEICAGEHLVLNANAQPGAGSITNYQWLIGGTSIPNASYDTLLIYTAGNYQVEVTNTANCKVKSIPDSVIVNQLPTGLLSMPDTNFICEGGTRLLQGSGGNSFQWYYNGDMIPGANASTYLAQQPGVYTLKLYSVEGCGNMANGTITLSLRKKPLIEFSYNSHCINLPIEFINSSDTSSSGSIKWYWDFGDGAHIDSIHYSPVHIYDSLTTDTVKLSILPLDCPDLISSSQLIVPIVAPTTGIQYPSVNTLKLTDTRLLARSIGNEFLWLPSTGLNNPNIINPIFNYGTEQLYFIQIKNQAGCMTVDTLLVRVFDNTDIIVPSAFSPNGDFHNDVLAIFLVGVDKFTIFRVFNRWGQLLFETDNPLQKWDGTFKGKKQPAEAYVWIAEGVDKKGNKIMRRGQTILLR